MDENSEGEKVERNNPIEVNVEKQEKKAEDEEQQCFTCLLPTEDTD